MDKRENERDQQKRQDDPANRPPGERPTGNRPNYDYNSGGRARDWNRGGDDWGGWKRGQR